MGSRELGATLSNPQDIFVTDEYIFLLDTGNNRILVFDHEWKLSHEISEFENSGEMDKFNNPRDCMYPRKVFCMSEIKITPALCR